MAHKINIMLMLVLGVTPSWGKSPFNISDSTKVDYRNIVEQFAPKLSKPASITDIREVMLLQPLETKSTRAHRERLAVNTFERNHNATRLKYGLNPMPSKKGNNSEPGKQYALYMDDRLLSEKEAFYIGKDTEGYTNSRRSHKPGTYTKFLNSIVRNFGSSIHMVGVHYWIVAGSG